MSNINSITVNVNNSGTVVGDYRTFSTGSKGWYANGKVAIAIGASRQPLNVLVDGQVILAQPRPMSDKGNFGWYASGKVTIDGQKSQVGINITACKCEGVEPLNTTVTCQVGGNIIIIGSKGETTPAPKSTKKPAKVAAKATTEPAAKVYSQESVDALIARILGR